MKCQGVSFPSHANVLVPEIAKHGMDSYLTDNNANNNNKNNNKA